MKYVEIDGKDLENEEFVKELEKNLENIDENSDMKVNVAFDGKEVIYSFKEVGDIENSKKEARLKLRDTRKCVEKRGFDVKAEIGKTKDGNMIYMKRSWNKSMIKDVLRNKGYNVDKENIELVLKNYMDMSTLTTECTFYDVNLEKCQENGYLREEIEKFEELLGKTLLDIITPPIVIEKKEAIIDNNTVYLLVLYMRPKH